MLKEIYLGESDIAVLTVASPKDAHYLSMGIDGTYSAILTDDKKEIPKEAEKVDEFGHWLNIYDDMGLAVEIKADKIEIYKYNYGEDFLIYVEGLKEDVADKCPDYSTVEEIVKKDSISESEMKQLIKFIDVELEGDTYTMVDGEFPRTKIRKVADYLLHATYEY